MTNLLLQTYGLMAKHANHALDYVINPLLYQGIAQELKPTRHGSTRLGVDKRLRFSDHPNTPIIEMKLVEVNDDLDRHISVEPWFKAYELSILFSRDVQVPESDITNNKAERLFVGERREYGQQCQISRFGFNGMGGFISYFRLRDVKIYADQYGLFHDTGDSPALVADGLEMCRAYLMKDSPKSCPEYMDYPAFHARFSGGTCTSIASTHLFDPVYHQSLFFEDDVVHEMLERANCDPFLRKPFASSRDEYGALMMLEGHDEEKLTDDDPF